MRKIVKKAKDSAVETKSPRPSCVTQIPKHRAHNLQSKTGVDTFWNMTLEVSGILVKKVLSVEDGHENQLKGL